ncbi:MAG TPA: hypothetical protein PK375_12760, partial [Rhodocyclaceae bacterium]|nr:hypothetical protein [Rhodocyclaceae bacterium]
DAGYAVWNPADSRIIEALGDVWRWLGWRVPDGEGGFTRLPAETYGPLPAPKRLASATAEN